MDIRSFFEKAAGCTAETRRWGLEVETLYVDEERDPVDHAVSRALFGSLRAGGWRPSEVKAGEIVGLDLQYTGDDLPYRIIYELGAGNVELITPTYPATPTGVDSGLEQIRRNLRSVHQHAGRLGAHPLAAPYDGRQDADTLVIPDERDRIWLTLDGPVLTVLGHIASVHVNLDLVDLDEGFDFIRRLNRLYERMDWPPREIREIWGRYITESGAGYEPYRYGPPPESFDDYVEMMRNTKVVMLRKPEGLEMVRPGRPLHTFNGEVDPDLFVRSVWLWSRLRVRRNRLVLEIRAIPRGSDDDIVRDVTLVLSELGILA